MSENKNTAVAHPHGIAGTVTVPDACKQGSTAQSESAGFSHLTNTPASNPKH